MGHRATSVITEDRISMSNESTSPTMKWILIAMISVMALGAVLVSLSMIIPQKWHYFFSKEDNNDINPRVYYPLFWHFKEANLTIVFEPVIEIELPPEFELAGRNKLDYITADLAGGTLQVSGIGFNTSLDKHFRYDYSFMSPPRLIVGTDEFHKEFLFTNRMTQVTVDATDYDLDAQAPLVFYIEKDGTMSKINSFAGEFGVELNDVLKNPTILSRALRTNMRKENEE